MKLKMFLLFVGGRDDVAALKSGLQYSQYIISHP